MPELPEVETARLRLEKALKGKVIREADADASDRFLFLGTDAQEFRRLLEGAKVKATGRKGKYFWLELDRKPWPVFHLGMTGDVEIRHLGKGVHRPGWGGLKLWSERGRDQAPPAGVPFFTRVHLRANNGTEVAITDPRKFGRVFFAENPLLHPRLKKLGFDPLQDFPAAKKLALLLRKRKAPIKAVLLDQKLFAGVGNYLADEFLFQAKISPHRIAAKLSAAEVARLRAKIISVIKKAVAVEADYEFFPKGWLFHHRWGKNVNARTHTKQKIVHEEIGGRTTAWVPSVQK
ncbi:MAG: Fpg/Nei family DNA glycosylase [Bacteriovoracia bacterium]